MGFIMPNFSVYCFLLLFCLFNVLLLYHNIVILLEVKAFNCPLGVFLINVNKYTAKLNAMIMMIVSGVSKN